MKDDTGQGTQDFTWEIEKQLLEQPSEKLRTFYSLTGPSRKDFLIQMAEAEAERIRIVGLAQAEAIKKVRAAEADGYRAVSEAIAGSPDKEALVRLVGLTAAASVAQALGSGQATKIFVPTDMGALFSFLGSLGDSVDRRS